MDALEISGNEMKKSLIAELEDKSHEYDRLLFLCALAAHRIKELEGVNDRLREILVNTPKEYVNSNKADKA